MWDKNENKQNEAGFGPFKKMAEIRNCTNLIFAEFDKSY